MTEERSVEMVEFECAEEGRTAHLQLEWQEELGTRRLVGVQCDNPKLQSLDNWECGWSCWQRVEDELLDKGER